MFPDSTHEPEMVTALDAKAMLTDLEAERVRAERTESGTYMAALEDEIKTVREVYVSMAVTEVATLRAELFGRQEG
jgi:hypothetical protein